MPFQGQLAEMKGERAVPGTLSQYMPSPSISLLLFLSIYLFFFKLISLTFKNTFISVFIYFWLAWAFTAVRGFL